MKLFFPDCLWTPHQISGSAFLYFHDEHLAFSLHPSVSSFMHGVDVFTFLPYLEKKNPPWKEKFMEFYKLWWTFKTSLWATQTLIEPIRKESFLRIMFSYNRGDSGWQSAGELVEASNLKIDEIVKFIDPYHASDELFSHIFFEKVLKARYGNQPQDFFIKLGQEQAKNPKAPENLIKDFEWSPVFEYCNDLFAKTPLPELLTRAYMFRIPMLHDTNEFLLSNNSLISFLASLPVSNASPNPDNNKIDSDVVAWEFFRQLVSPYIDPLDTSKIKLLQRMLRKRKEEIERLKGKCYELENDLKDVKDIATLTENVRTHIKAKVSKELNELLKLDTKAFENYIAELLADEKNWIAVATFLASLLHGGSELLTAGSAIYALSRVGAKAFKEAAKRREKLSTNSYTLIYRMNHSG